MLARTFEPPLSLLQFGPCHRLLRAYLFQVEFCLQTVQHGIVNLARAMQAQDLTARGTIGNENCSVMIGPLIGMLTTGVDEAGSHFHTAAILFDQAGMSLHAVRAGGVLLQR